MTDKKTYGVNVKDFGAIGDGEHDDGAAFQAAIDAESSLVVIPSGKYKIGRPLFLGSDIKISAHDDAHIRLADNVCVKRGDFLLSNKNPGTGDRNIELEGGICDGNNQGNPRLGELFDPDCVSGTLINFRNVKNLVMSGMVLRDPEAYYIRICEIDGFVIEKIRFEAEHMSKNQDGIHMAGFCKNGVIRYLKAVGEATNDDFLAFNADDCITRRENLDTICGPIENIKVYDVEAENCFTFIRMLSVDSAISSIDISNIRGGCKHFFLNMDGARYCRTPLIPVDSERFTAGAGDINNISISDADIEFLGDVKARICNETNLANVKIKNFCSKDERKIPCVTAVNCKKSSFVFQGINKVTAEKIISESSCKNIEMCETADRNEREVYRVEAEKNIGEKLIMPSGNFEELKVNSITV